MPAVIIILCLSQPSSLAPSCLCQVLSHYALCFSFSIFKTFPGLPFGAKEAIDFSSKVLRKTYGTGPNKQKEEGL